jgi:FtsP/CotA-like multicopper oxidase with cupredoxin domain
MLTFIMRVVVFFFALIFLFLGKISLAAEREYNLAIDYKTVNYTGQDVKAMSINGSIPGPVLRFREGDTARIHVQNRMDVDTSIHWHGMLVPPDMDGVPFVSFPPIAPGTTFPYEFPIRHSGTYWYHSHTGLQEQKGVYGSIVIEPDEDLLKTDRDHVVMLSDWTDEDTHEVLRTLKLGSEWYSVQKGSGQSILGAARIGMLGDYFKRELQRMPAMDIADIAYDFFLANGKPETTLYAEPGETVRLRIIDGAASTNFHLEFAEGLMTVISADGIDVQPFEQKRFMIAIAETYDVIVKIPKSGTYEFRATAQDGSGYTSVWIGSGKRYPAPDVPKPNLYHTMGSVNLKQTLSLTPAGAMGMPDRDVEAGKFDRPGMMGMDSMKMDTMKGMGDMKKGSDMSGMDMKDMVKTSSSLKDRSTHSMKDMSRGGYTVTKDKYTGSRGNEFGDDFRLLSSDVSATKDLAVDGMDPGRPWPPYANLRAIKPITLPKDRPVREIRLTLDGDMERYVWFLKNRPLSESDSILIRKGEVVRFIMINRTMMHHPMHLHGHFFRVINGQGDFSPLKHTINVAPMSTTVIEFDANEFGDWFFHCHLLYHLKSGMARVVHYEGYTLNPQLSEVRPNLFGDFWYFWVQADVMSNMTQGFLTLSNTRNIFTAEWEAGWQLVDDTESEAILTWDRYFNRFFTAFIGADLLGEGDDLDEARAVAGIRYLLPLNIESRLWVDSDGGARISLGKEFELTPRIALFGEGEYDTHDLLEGIAGFSYTISKRFSLIGQWHSDFGFGGGVRIRF